MTSVRFHRSIYGAAAIAEAVAMFAEHGQLRVDDSDAERIVVHLAASEQAGDVALAGAFANYALGASVHAHNRQSVTGITS